MPNYKALGIVFSNMHDEELHELTFNRTTASIPFGGRYRLIDFVLSNMVNSGIMQVGVIAKSNYQSLMDHVGSGKEWDLARKRGGLTILPPFSIGSSIGMYKGSIEAVAGVLNYISASSADYVVLSDCSVITNIDFTPVIDAHIESGAEMTLICSQRTGKHITKGRLAVTCDENGFLTGATLGKGDGELYHTSMVVIERKLLIKRVEQAIAKGQYSFHESIMKHGFGDRKILCYNYDGVALEICDMDSYITANMALLNVDIRKNLFDRERPIYTKVRDQVPAKYGLRAKVENSLVADGCIIEGTVRNSIIFRGVKVDKGAVVENCILMQDTIVEENATLCYVVADKNVIIDQNRHLAGYTTYPLFIPKGKHI